MFGGVFKRKYQYKKPIRAGEVLKKEEAHHLILRTYLITIFLRVPNPVGNQVGGSIPSIIANEY